MLSHNAGLTSGGIELRGYALGRQCSNRGGISDRKVNAPAINFGGGITNISINYMEDLPNRAWDDVFSGSMNAIKLTSKNIPTLNPQISFLLQLFQRGGIRLNMGTQIYYISQTSWKLDDYISVTDANNGDQQIIVSPYLQAFIYFGM